MAIGDGLCDPVTMTDYGDFLYGIGLVDEAQRDAFEQMQHDILKLIVTRQWKKAFEVNFIYIFFLRDFIFKKSLFEKLQY